LKAVEDIAERARFSEDPGSLLEIVFTDGLTEL
jgi:hypothetical protein